MAQSGSALSHFLLFATVAILSLDPAKSQITTVPGIVTPDITTIVINNDDGK